MPLIPGLRSQGQADEFEVSLVYLISFRLAKATERDPA